eukprot:TRINITY_DN8989_c0_g1_i3.p1 TRINITY_DN8989_c0_g1~~TRINITY_DN8989_c0_g1_i3.p1  ORF type:complete len:579 (+),score=99.79 TRINITY_DN8989_c0_g1_i3:24-1739(+)
MGSGASLPGEPATAAEKKLEHLDLVPHDSKTWSALCQLLHVPDPQNLGVGRDVSEHEEYDSIKPVHAWKIDMDTRAMLYAAAKKMAIEDIEGVCKDIEGVKSITKVGDVETKIDKVGIELARCQDKKDITVHDHVLLHGTKPELIRTILRNGLSEKFSSGLFGKGLYLTEDPSKADQYCTTDRPGDESLDDLHEDLYGKTGLEHPGPVCYMLVCRVTIGIPVYTKDGKTDMHPPHKEVFHDDSKRELAAIEGSDPPIPYHTLIAEAGPKHDGFYLQRHREYVVFSANRVMEEYLVAFKRENSRARKSSERPEPTQNEVQEGASSSGQGNEANFMETSNGTTLQVPPLIPPAGWKCDLEHNFVAGVRYSQRDLCSPAISGARVYGEGGDVLKWCAENCPTGAIGFFYQMHGNGHEIVGYYMESDAPDVENAPRSGGHKQGALCFKEGGSNAGNEVQTMQTSNGTTLQVPPLIPPDGWKCDLEHNFVRGARYSQRDLCSPAISGARVYGEGGDVLKWCADNCPTGAVGFFYQMHPNGHEIVGYFMEDDAEQAERSGGGHKQGAVCFKESSNNN